MPGDVNRRFSLVLRRDDECDRERERDGPVEGGTRHLLLLQQPGLFWVKPEALLYFKD